jgi:hypothetical protein
MLPDRVNIMADAPGAGETGRLAAGDDLQLLIDKSGTPRSI